MNKVINPVSNGVFGLTVSTGGENVNIEFFDDELDLVVRVASPEDDHPPGLSLAEVLGGLGPMVLSARQL